MKLTEHFTLEEMTFSATGRRLGLSNEPPDEIIKNILYTAQVLQVVRAGLGGHKLRVLSCYRSPAVNKAVGGSPRSAHIHGLAADFRVENVSVSGVCRWIADNMTGFDQVIYEFGEEGWCHLGLKPEGAPVRQQTLTAVKKNGRTEYLTGIV